MHNHVGEYILRLLEPCDQSALYAMKNDPEVAGQLGGFGTGYSSSSILEWIENHRRRADEVLWAIASANTNVCVGHVGFYKIDFRIRSAEFAILIGDKSVWGKGIGKQCTLFAIRYGFEELNLNRISLSVLAGNTRALHLYHSAGFQTEGVLRQAQYKCGQYQDLVLMSMLRSEYDERA